MRNFHFQTALLPEGWAEDVVIAVEDGVIADMSVGAPCPPFTDRLAGIAIPGIPNLHSHAHQRAMAGLTERSGDGVDSFWTWREAMYRAVQAITPEDLQVIATHAFIEMLAGGYTHVAEFHYLHHQPDGTPYSDPAEMARRIIAAAEATGIGLTLLPVLYAAAGFDGVPPSAGQARFASDLDGFGTLRAALPPPGRGMVWGVAPHSLRAVPPPALAGLLDAAPDGPIHIHVAEQMREVEECVAATGQRPVAWLLDHAAVDARWCLVHATHADAAEVAAITRSGAVVGLCPTTEADLGDGVFAAAALQAAGGAFGVGSDSQVSASALEELRLLEWGQRLVSGRRTVLAGGAGRSTGRTLIEAAASAGARACGIAAGAIEVGMRADVVVLAEGAGTGDAALDGAVFASRRSPVRHVVAQGECVIRDGAHRLAGVAARAVRARDDAAHRRGMSAGLARSLSLALSALAGYVDAAGFLMLGGFYVAFMSGNSTLLGIGTAAGSEPRMVLAGGLVLCFVLGVMLGTLVGRRMTRLRPAGVLLMVSVLLTAAVGMDRMGWDAAAGFMLATAMGAENTVFNRDGVSGVGLTYMTGTLVRLGQRLAEALTGGRWSAAWPDTLLWVAMVLGALAGALVFQRLGADALLLAVAATLAMAGLAAWRVKHG